MPVTEKFDRPREAEVKPTADPRTAEELASLSQVRDILFGSEMRRLDADHADLDARLSRDLASLRTQFLDRLDTLGRETQAAHAELASRIEAEHSSRLEEMQAQRDELLARIERETSELSAKKADRGTLANLLRQFAEQIENGGD